MEIISKEFIKPSSPTTMDSKKTCQHLKQSLSESLTRFYPLAGRINDSNLCFIDCDDSGALFIEAQVHAQLSEKLSQSTAIEELNQYLPLELYAHDADNIPLAIQISFFECGGMAIGVCISHKVADAMSFVTFMTTWADGIFISMQV
ncbi:stemmadenine O-acetyltransferase-like [Coffea arabica]|uniref:Stemmadenine O-acetyltransferase-like n=1 Tax=Coffea arabica TaxID=13443 RepID=A0ABM4UYT1_COFAR